MFRLLVLCFLWVVLSVADVRADDAPATTFNFKPSSRLSSFLVDYCARFPCGRVVVRKVVMTRDHDADFEIHPLGDDCKAQTCPVVFLYSKEKLTKVDFPKSTKWGGVEGKVGFIEWLPRKESEHGRTPGSFTVFDEEQSCKILWEWSGTKYEERGCLEDGRGGG